MLYRIQFTALDGIVPTYVHSRLARRAAHNIKQEVGSSRVIFAPIGWGAGGDFERFEHALKREGVDYKVKLIKQDDALDTDYGEFRPVLTPPEEFMDELRGYRADTLVLFEDWAGRSGTNFTGAVKWALNNKQQIGINRLYLSAVRDNLGIVHFPIYTTQPYIGMTEFMRRTSPKIFAELENDGLRMVAKGVPHRDEEIPEVPLYRLGIRDISEILHRLNERLKQYELSKLIENFMKRNYML